MWRDTFGMDLRRAAACAMEIEVLTDHESAPDCTGIMLAVESSGEACCDFKRKYEFFFPKQESPCP